MIKLFASDLDGTLFNAFHNVDRTILDAARAIVATGAHLVLATGRTVISARDLGFEDVPIEAVGSNGSIIRDGAGEIIKTFPLDPAELEDLMRSFPHVCFDCVAPEGSYITGTREDHEAGFRRDGLVRRIVMRGMRQRRRGAPFLPVDGRGARARDMQGQLPCFGRRARTRAQSISCRA